MPSNQSIEQLVVEKAMAVSQRLMEAVEIEAAEALARTLMVNRELAIYEPSESQVLLLNDGIGVKPQKLTRGCRIDTGAESVSLTESTRKRIIGDVIQQVACAATLG